MIKVRNKAIDRRTSPHAAEWETCTLTIEGSCRPDSGSCCHHPRMRRQAGLNLQRIDPDTCTREPAQSETIAAMHG